MNIVFDIINFGFVILIFIVSITVAKLQPVRSLLILFHLISIFMFNGVLFPASYFSDQFNYFGTAELIRNTFPFDMIKYHILNRTPHYVAGTIFALFPLPFIASIYSLSMINFLIYLFILLYMKKKNINNHNVDYFFLLYPSLMLYSSLALREILILLFMFFVLYHIIIHNNFFIAFLYSVPLFLLKFQNVGIIILTIPLYYILRRNIKKRLFALIIFSVTFFYVLDYIPLVNFLIERVEYYRFYMFAENFGYNWDLVLQQNYNELKRGLSLLAQILFSSLYFLLTPLPWEVRNPFQIIQFFENIILISIIIYVHKQYKFLPVIKEKVIFLNSFLFVYASIYGLVVFNYGAIARYRFPLITVYFLFLLYLYHWNKNLSLFGKKKDHITHAI